MSGWGTRFASKVALITGASRGIGFAVARRIVAEGGKVCITARKAEQLRDAAAQLGGCDVAVYAAGSADDAGHQDCAVATARQAFGRLDILVNNTGINPTFGPLLDTDPGAMRKIIDVNLLANIEWVRRTVPAGVTSVVNISSVAGILPAAGIGFYGASKAALMHLTQQLAVELAPDVRVNAVAPAVVRTRFGGPLFEGKEAEVTTRYPLRALGEPDHVAAAVAYLASDDAAWTTGQVLTLDGGLTLTGGV